MPAQSQTNASEQWLPIAEYPALYQVSNLGNVRTAKGVAKKKRIGARGYYQVRLCDNYENRCRTVSKLVALAFVPNPESLPVVNHKDGNKLNDRADNLEWTTVAGNTQHAWDNGLLKRANIQGGKNGASKLQAECVALIRSRAANGERLSLISKDYGMSAEGVRLIVTRQRWSHV